MLYLTTKRASFFLGSLALVSCYCILTLQYADDVIQDKFDVASLMCPVKVLKILFKQTELSTCCISATQFMRIGEEPHTGSASKCIECINK